MQGRFIVFEGIDGSGKSTQARLLCDALTKQGAAFSHYREPGGTALGEEIRKILLEHRTEEMTPQSELLLYLAARAQLLDDHVRPDLKAGRSVILDRYYYSTAAYQGEGTGLGLETVLTLCTTLGFEPPDQVFLLDLPYAEALKRTDRARDRIEQRGPDYFERVRRGFLTLAQREPSRFVVLDATARSESLHQTIRERVLSLRPR